MNAHGGSPQPGELRRALDDGHLRLAGAWATDRDVDAMLAGRSDLVDRTLTTLWQRTTLPARASLVAVGGYGRGELFPYSDVDLLFLVDDDTDAAALEAPMGELLNALWDLGLDIGHSVRSVGECVEVARTDITVQTALLEARYLCGDEPLFARFAAAFRQALDPVSFFKGKQLEQAARHARHNDTPYALEPNCKDGPGGLRDLHMIRWCARSAGVGDDWSQLASSGVLRLSESRQLALAERRLKELRIDLHLLTRRAEERLLFDVQERVAAGMGIVPDGALRASEVLMQRYYRNARRVSLLNALALAALAERIDPDADPTPVRIDDHFQSVGNRLDIVDAGIFDRDPANLFECFRLQMARTDLAGLTPRTQRALWQARHLIDDAFRADPARRAQFIDLFRQPHLVRVFRRMNQYNILGRYLPAFGDIVGRMQHDLFHVYTVDQHILQVIRNLRRFAMSEFAHEYPFCSRLMSEFDHHWLLYVAALFHDIAKGRGGDHSQLGKTDAAQFCATHGIAAEDAALVVFLVEHHLTMSSVAQKQDLSDPETIAAFAGVVGDPRRLTALYLLTVADLRGTSPKVWNTWKAKLLEDLYRMTCALFKGQPLAQTGGVAERKDEARRLLRLRGLRPDIEADLWSRLDTAYFMRHDAEVVAWHTRNLYYRAEAQEPVVCARLLPKVGGIQVMAYVADQPLLFARLCRSFARLGFNIVDARIHTTRHGYALDSFVLLSADPLADRDAAALLEHQLGEALQHKDELAPLPVARLSRQVKHFPVQPAVDIRADERGGQYVMMFSAADRRGLLFDVAVILARYDVRLHTAKITTLGERIEDVFLISGTRLGTPATLVRLEQDLLAALTV